LLIIIQLQLPSAYRSQGSTAPIYPDSCSSVSPIPLSSKTILSSRTCCTLPPEGYRATHAFPPASLPAKFFVLTPERSLLPVLLFKPLFSLCASADPRGLVRGFSYSAHLLIRNDSVAYTVNSRPPEEVKFKALCGPCDNAEPVIAIILPGKDGNRICCITAADNSINL